MSIHKLPSFRLLTAALLIAFVLLLAGCATDVPQNTFDVKGDVASKQRDIFNLALWPAIVILILVEGALLFALIWFRQRRGQGLPKQVHGNLRLEITWTLVPALLILVLGGLMIPIIVDLSDDPKPDALQVDVIARQWSWEFQYPQFKDAQGNPVSVVNEMHIPVDRQIAVRLQSGDVIHSFWVPKLAGKLDAVPGRTNEMWFNARTSGEYSGQCAEFCGLGHALMRLQLIAQSEGEFQNWIKGQQSAVKSGSTEPALARQGE